MNIKVNPDWWKDLFTEAYLVTDGRSVCNPLVTKAEVDFICSLLFFIAADKILDCCGGQGRHSLELYQRGFTNLTVFDFSEDLTRIARQSADASGYNRMKVVRGDARQLPFSDGVYDHVLCLGNSLGYIPMPEADERIVAEMRRVCRPDGWALIDVSDGSHLLTLPPESVRQTEDGKTVKRQRQFVGDRLNVLETLIDQHGGVRQESFSIRVWNEDRLRQTLQQGRFSRVEVFPFQTADINHDRGGMNNRLMAIGQKI